MKARANTRFTQLRGGTTDSFGDPKDVPKEIRKGITASLIERTKTVSNPADGMVRQVRYLVGRIPAGTSIQAGDRFKDERTGFIYVFDASSVAMNPVRGSDIVLDLRRVT